MGVYRPQYKDKKTGKMKHTKTWYYEFIFAGRLIKESSKSTSKTVAKEAERQRRRELETGFNGLADSRNERVLSLAKVAEKFLVQYRVRQPKSAKFAEHALRHVSRLVGQMMLVDVTDKRVQKYQTERLKEFAALDGPHSTYPRTWSRSASNLGSEVDADRISTKLASQWPPSVSLYPAALRAVPAWWPYRLP